MWRSFSFVIHQGEIILSGVISLCCCPAIPFKRLRIILGHTFSIVIQQTKVELCHIITLLGGFLKPPYGLCIVGFYALTFVIHQAEIRLAVSIALFRSLAKPVDSFNVILLFIQCRAKIVFCFCIPGSPDKFTQPINCFVAVFSCSEKWIVPNIHIYEPLLRIGISLLAGHPQPLRRLNNRLWRTRISKKVVKSDIMEPLRNGTLTV